MLDSPAKELKTTTTMEELSKKLQKLSLEGKAGETVKTILADINNPNARAELQQILNAAIKLNRTEIKDYIAAKNFERDEEIAELAGNDEGAMDFEEVARGKKIFVKLKEVYADEFKRRGGTNNIIFELEQYIAGKVADPKVLVNSKARTYNKSDNSELRVLKSALRALKDPAHANTDYPNYFYGDGKEIYAAGSMINPREFIAYLWLAATDQKLSISDDDKAKLGLEQCLENEKKQIIYSLSDIRRAHNGKNDTKGLHSITDALSCPMGVIGRLAQCNVHNQQIKLQELDSIARHFDRKANVFIFKKFSELPIFMQFEIVMSLYHKCIFDEPTLIGRYDEIIKKLQDKTFAKEVTSLAADARYSKLTEGNKEQENTFYSQFINGLLAEQQFEEFCQDLVNDFIEIEDKNLVGVIHETAKLDPSHHTAAVLSLLKLLHANLHQINQNTLEKFQELFKSNLLAEQSRIIANNLLADNRVLQYKNRLAEIVQTQANIAATFVREANKAEQLELDNWQKAYDYSLKIQQMHLGLDAEAAQIKAELKNLGISKLQENLAAYELVYQSYFGENSKFINENMLNQVEFSPLWLAKLNFQLAKHKGAARNNGGMLAVKLEQQHQMLIQKQLEKLLQSQKFKMPKEVVQINQNLQQVITNFWSGFMQNEPDIFELHAQLANVDNAKQQLEQILVNAVREQLKPQNSKQNTLVAKDNEILQLLREPKQLANLGVSKELQKACDLLQDATKVTSAHHNLEVIVADFNAEVVAKVDEYQKQLSDVIQSLEAKTPLTDLVSKQLGMLRHYQLDIRKELEFLQAANKALPRQVVENFRSLEAKSKSLSLNIKGLEGAFAGLKGVFRRFSSNTDAEKELIAKFNSLYLYQSKQRPSIANQVNSSLIERTKQLQSQFQPAVNSNTVPNQLMLLSFSSPEAATTTTMSSTDIPKQIAVGYLEKAQNCLQQEPQVLASLNSNWKISADADVKIIVCPKGSISAEISEPFSSSAKSRICLSMDDLKFLAKHYDSLHDAATSPVEILLDSFSDCLEKGECYTEFFIDMLCKQFADNNEVFKLALRSQSKQDLTKLIDTLNSKKALGDKCFAFLGTLSVLRDNADRRDIGDAKKQLQHVIEGQAPKKRSQLVFA